MAIAAAGGRLAAAISRAKTGVDTDDSMIRTIVADLDPGGRRRTARRAARAFSIAAARASAEHGLGIVVGERDPAERQLLADEALQRRRCTPPT